MGSLTGSQFRKPEAPVRIGAEALGFPSENEGGGSRNKSDSVGIGPHQVTAGTAAKLKARLALGAENRHHARSEVRRFRVVRFDGKLLCGATSLELAARYLANVTRDGEKRGYASIVMRRVSP